MSKRTYGGWSGVEGGGGSYGGGDRKRTDMGPRRGRTSFTSKRKFPAGARRYSKRYPRALSFQGIETKYFDTIKSASALAAPPATTAWAGLEQNPTTTLCFNCPTQGSGASNREGRKITCLSLQLNGVIACAAQGDQAALDVMPTIKLFLVLDRQTNGTEINSEDVYTNPVATAIGGAAPLRNMLYSKRFKVLKEIKVDMSQLQPSWDGTNMEQSGAQIAWDMFVPLKGIVTEFAASAGTVADITTNGLFLVGCTSSTQVAPQITYNARLRFRG